MSTPPGRDATAPHDGRRPCYSRGCWALRRVHTPSTGGCPRLFAVIFWLTTVVMLGVFAVMIYFIIKYRFNPNRKKAHFSHGNPKLEMIWTIIPAIILTVISLYSKGVWDTYRHGNPSDTRKVARILVIGEQFQWNVIYAGPDGKIGKYLIYPKPSDKYWPRNADGTPFTMSYKDY